jgi:hypothetical protein
MSQLEKYQQYSAAARTALTKNPNFIQGHAGLSEEAFDHVASIGASVMMTRDKFQLGGGFVTAVVNNDLSDAVNRADTDCIRALKYFVYVNRFVHLPAGE